MIELRDLQFSYSGSEFALQIPELTIGAAQHTALIGPSGCGKTTLLNLLAGILEPQAGEVNVAGNRLTGLDDRARRRFRSRELGLVFQNFELLDYLDVLDNILLPLRIGGDLPLTAELRRRASELAGQVGIGGKLRRYPGQLSQGERQRVAVSRALLLQPSLVLADEPTGNLDPSNKMLVLDLLLDYVRDSGATLLTVTHDRDLLPRFEQVVDFGNLNRWQP